MRFALFALRFYKMYLSALMGGTCRFEPTCSNYAFEAVERFGLWRGCWLTLKRLARCQPLSRKFGFDPVPERWPEEEEESGILASISSENPGSVTLGPKEVVCQPQETSFQRLKPHCEVGSYGTTKSRALTQHEAHS